MDMSKIFRVALRVNLQAPGRKFPGDPGCNCELCDQPIGREDYPFMLDTEVWFEAVGTELGFAHLYCVYARLEREPVLQDFPNVPINSVVRDMLLLRETFETND